MPNQGFIPGTQKLGYLAPTGEANLRALATPIDELRAAAEVNRYPRFVVTDELAYAAAKSPEERRAFKVLVADEAAHRALKPSDFPDADDATDTTAAPRRRRGPSGAE